MSKFLDRVAHSLVHKEARGDPGDPELNDLSYEDALFDVELRAFFRNEYGSVKPPSGVFRKVLNAILRHEEREANPFRIWDLGFRIEPKSQIRNGLLSGSIVTALLLLALGPSLIAAVGRQPVAGLDAVERIVESQKSKVQSQDRWTLDFPLSTTNADADPQEIRQLTPIEVKTGEDLSAPSAGYQPLEAPALDPFELGIDNHRNYRQNNPLGKPGPQ